MEIFIVKDNGEYLIIYKHKGHYEVECAQTIMNVYFNILLYLDENPVDALVTYSTDLEILSSLAGKDLNLRYGEFDTD